MEIELNIEEEPKLAGQDSSIKKRYCDKQFKKNISKAIKANHGEPDNIDKIFANRHLGKYSKEKIIDYVNVIAKDVQKLVEGNVEKTEYKNVLKLASLMNDICESEKPQELPLVLKLKAECKDTPDAYRTHNVHFSELTRFLYSAVNGHPDYANLNKESLNVLHNTHRMLMEQIEHDATPEFLDELKQKICAGRTEESHPSASCLANIFQDKSLNPMDFPFEYLLNGTLPAFTQEDETAKPTGEGDSVQAKSKKSVQVVETANSTKTEDIKASYIIPADPMQPPKKKKAPIKPKPTKLIP